MSETGDALLSQILTEVRATRAQVAGIEITVAQAVAEIRHRAEQGDDHEERLRALERADVVTTDDLIKSQVERQAKQRAWMAMALTVFGLVETAVIAVLVRG